MRKSSYVTVCESICVSMRERSVCVHACVCVYERVCACVRVCDTMYLHSIHHGGLVIGTRLPNFQVAATLTQRHQPSGKIDCRDPSFSFTEDVCAFFWIRLNVRTSCVERPPVIHCRSIPDESVCQTRDGVFFVAHQTFYLLVIPFEDHQPKPR